MKKHKKQDCSVHVPQGDKIKNQLQIRSLNWTPKQQEIISLATDKDTKIIIIDGVPGTGKSILSVYCSLLLMNDKKVSDLVYIRSVIQASDGQTGYLAGDLSQKMELYNLPLMDKLNELLYKDDINKLINEQRIITYPTSMLRSYNFAAKVVISEESQNMCWDSLFTIATRLGKFSKLFIIGDSKYQNDLGKRSGFEKFCKIFNDEESRSHGIFYRHFDSSDIMRSDVVKFIVEKIEKFDNLEK